MKLLLSRQMLFSACLLTAGSGLGVAAERDEFFAMTVEPVLRQRCFECHSHEKKIKGGLALDSRSGWEKGGDNGPAVVPGDLGKSHLVEAVRYTNPDMEMPPKGKLAAAEIEVLEQWVQMGAPDPRRNEPIVKKGRVIDIEAGRKFWAFRPVQAPERPAVKEGDWALDPIDDFILAKLEAASLRPAPDADRYTWLRRVSLDLIGLPPSPEEIAAFVRDTSAEAYATVVDRLLASPAFGERWARHWLDLTGYADQIGTSNSIFAEHAWRYRDYVIAAFNADKPFDRFIREQIAGDLLPAATPQARAEQVTATGFLVLGDIEIVSVDKTKMEVDLVDQQISKLGTAFLGMTLGCVRCHDHKFDPIAQTDYYAMAGILRSTSSTYKTEYGVWSSVNTAELPESPRTAAERLQRVAENEANIRQWQAERSSATSDKAALEKEMAAAAEASKPELEKKRGELLARIKALDAQIEHAHFFTPVCGRAYAVHDRDKPADMRVTIRGNPYALGDSVKRGFLRVASWNDQPPAIPDGQSGRVQLADWIADGRNPLTARVAVNRIWQKLFGEGLVRSVDYFGTRGEPPTHRELLDHLAARLVSGGWSQKKFIRSVVLSRAYRMSSAHDAAASAKDPENRLLWRMNRQRLDAEAIRDTLLAVSGKLLRSTGGPAMPLEYPENVTGINPKGVNPPAFRFSKLRPSQEFVRTIYLPVIRTGTQPGAARLRDVFDFVQPAQIAGKRAETSVPTQALYLLNSEMLRARATELAMAMRAAVADPEERLQQLWLRALNRPITPDEADEAGDFLRALGKSEGADAELASWTELCHTLFSSNEFLLKL